MPILHSASPNPEITSIPCIQNFSTSHGDCFTCKLHSGVMNRVFFSQFRLTGLPRNGILPWTVKTSCFWCILLSSKRDKHSTWAWGQPGDLCKAGPCLCHCNYARKSEYFHINSALLGTEVSFFFFFFLCPDYPAACYYNVYYPSHITIITAIMEKRTRDGEKHVH